MKPSRRDHARNRRNALFLPTIIPGPSPAKAPRLWNCWPKFPISTRWWFPIGGGGLISGSSIAAHAIRPGIRIFGVEPEQGNDTLLSLRAGERIGIPMPETIADGLRSPKPGAITFPIVQKHVEDIVLVSDDEIRDAMKFLLTRMKILVEPSGAASAAAGMLRKLPPGIPKIGVILSGGNVGSLIPGFFQETAFERPIHQIVGQFERQLLEVNQIDGMRENIARMAAANGRRALR